MKKTLNFILPPVFGLLISVVVLAAAAIIICYAPVGKGAYDIAVTCAKILGSVLSGFFSAKGAVSKGWLKGGLSGTVYVLLLFLISGFKNPVSLLRAVPKGFFFGAIGGIIGINAGK